MFNEIFPPSFNPINAGFMSMAENDIHDRVLQVYNSIVADYGTIVPSADIIDHYLTQAGLEPWILSPEDYAILDQLDIIEG